MTDTRLLEEVMELREKNLPDEEVKKRLTSRGWSMGDINGALALHTMTTMPVGSRPMPEWLTAVSNKHERKGRTLVRTVVLVAILVVAAVVAADWNGYAVPPLHQYQIKETLLNSVNTLHAMDVIPASK